MKRTIQMALIILLTPAFCSCHTQRHSLERDVRVRTDSLMVTVTEEAVLAAVPPSEASLTLSPDKLKMLTTLPAGFSLTARDGKLALAAESDGQGGVQLTAVHEGAQREQASRKTVTGNRVRDETVTQEESRETRRRIPAWIYLLTVGLLAAVVCLAFKYRSNNH